MDQKSDAKLEVPNEEANVSHEVSPSHQKQEKGEKVNEGIQERDKEDSLDKEL